MRSAAYFERQKKKKDGGQLAWGYWTSGGWYIEGVMVELGGGYWFSALCIFIRWGSGRERASAPP
jgi:hypothetical protein